jgi:putative spermidine/putrescine transport system substrate-binding protein
MLGRRSSFVLLVFAGLLVGAACSGDDEEPPVVEPVVVLDEVGDPEGELNLLAFAGYVEDGSSDPAFDWVTPFRRDTGCSVHVQYADSGDEMLDVLTTEDSGFDGASVPGDIARELINGRSVAAVDPEIIPGWDRVLAPLRGDNARHYIVEGDVFGVPALYGPNFLMFDERAVRPKPTSWEVVYEPDTKYAGRIAMLDSPMSIADAALYLTDAEPELGIDDPYALTPPQLEAATNLLQQQAPLVGLYWTFFTDTIEAFGSGDVVVGTGWPIALSLLQIQDRPIAALIPEEGATGWADTWMVAADAEHPNCMLLWMGWTLSAEVQDEMARWYGGAPSNAHACELIREELGDFADLADSLRFGRCGDREFLASLELWRTPTVDCGDERGRACTGAPAWREAWEDVRR